jgi:hypothetical protein
MKGLTVYIPDNLDLDQLLKDHPPTAVKSFNQDYLAYIISLMYSNPSRYKNLLEDGEYIPLCTEVLKDLIGNGDQYLRYLIASDVFITDGQYIKGEKCKGYLLGKEYRGRTKRYRITYPKLIRKLDVNRRHNTERIIRKLPYLHKWYKTKKLTIDKDCADSTLQAKYEVKLKERIKRGSSLTKREIADLSLQSWTSHIDRLYNKKYEHTYAIDDQGGRLYTILTNLSSDFRKFVTYNGIPLVNVDIANSQPYFSTLLLDPAFWIKLMLSQRQKEKVKAKLRRKGIKIRKFRISENLTSIKLNPKIKSQITDKYKCDITYSIYYLMFVNNEESDASTEFERYTKLVISGELYEYFIDEWRSRRKKRLTRDEAKKIMFTIFFSPDVMVESFLTPHARLFQELFPRIFDLFNKIKAQSHNTLAILLQNIESQAMLHQICARIAAEHPSIPIFTIHDSVVTTSGNEQVIKAIMQDELEKITGLLPTLKIEEWR